MKRGVGIVLALVLVAVALALFFPSNSPTGLQVAELNEAPRFVGAPFQVNSSLSIDLRDYFVDPEGEALGFAVDDAQVSMQGFILTFTAPQAAGEYMVNVQVSDGTNTVYKPLTFVVEPQVSGELTEVVAVEVNDEPVDPVLVSEQVLPEVVGAVNESIEQPAVEQVEVPLLVEEKSVSSETSSSGVQLSEVTVSADCLTTPGLDLVVSANLVLNSSISCTNITVQSGAQLFVNSSANGGTAITITATGNITIENGAAINGTGLGYAGGALGANGAGPGGAGTGGPSNTGSGAGHGGIGGQGQSGSTGGPAYGSSLIPITQGSGGGGGWTTAGGVGGAGGAAIHLNVSEYLMLNGGVESRGVAGAAGDGAGGGGAGGSILINASAIIGSGTISARGGNGGDDVDTNDGGSGAGGRVAIYANSTTIPFTSIAVAGGTIGTGAVRAGQSGTLAFIDKDDNALTISQSFRWMDGEAIPAFAAITIANATTRYNLSDMNLSLSAGRISLENATITSDRLIGTYALRVWLNITAGNLSVDSLSVVNLTAGGFAGGVTGTGGAGPGAGGGSPGLEGVGGGYGGFGGRSQSVGSTGAVYGSALSPSQLGSGGGGGAAVGGGSGGGVLTILVNDTFSLNGSFDSQGLAGSNGDGAGGGGSGGTIFVNTTVFGGTGTLTVRGGNGGIDTVNGNNNGGAGAGGRLVVYHNLSTFAGTLNASGGTPTSTAERGQDGSIALINQLRNELHVVNSFRWQRMDFDGRNFSLINVSRAFTRLNQTSISINASQIILTNSTISAVAGGATTTSTLLSLATFNLSGENISFDSQSSIDVDGAGGAGGAVGVNGGGDGGGNGNGGQEGAGAGHGALGGNSPTPTIGGITYGSLFAPVRPGSGGGGGWVSSSGVGGNGGGAVAFLASGTVVINGTIDADARAGANGNGAGGAGSGGSIYITAGTLSGAGNLTARGGAGGVDDAADMGGGGAGGRISLVAQSNSFTGVANASGGLGQPNAQSGGAGSVFLCSGLAGINCPGSGNGITLVTNVSDNTTVQYNRTITSFTQSLVRFNDSTNKTITVTYNLTGLAPNTPYSITDNGAAVATYTTDGSGRLAAFNRTLSSPHEIIVINDANNPPSIAQVVLNSTDGSGALVNRAASEENLTVHITASDGDADAIKNITNWYLNSSSALVLNMPFEGGTNTTFAKDYSPFGNNASFSSSGFSTTDGYDGFGAFNFAGLADTITIQNSSSLSLADNFSVELRFLKSGSGSERFLISKDNAWRIRYPYANHTLEFRRDDNSDFVDWDVGDGVWTHLVATKNSTHIALYINGSLVESTASTGALTNLGNNMFIGSQSGTSNSFSGRFDEIRMYNRSLSAEQISALYNNYTHLVEQETALGDIWGVQVTANDRTSDSSAIFSNNVTISANTHPSIAQVILNNSNGAGYNLNISNTTSDLSVFIINATDSDNDSIQNITDWRINGTSIALVNMPFETNVSLNTSGAVREYSSFGNNASLGNGTGGTSVPLWNSSGKVGGAYTFDGLRTGITGTNVAALNTPSLMTVAAWVYPVNNQSSNNQHIVAKYLDSSDDGWLFRLTSLATFDFDIRGTSFEIYRSAVGVAPLNTWTHLAAVYNSSAATKAQLYVNGQPVSASVSGGTTLLTAGTAPFVIGYTRSTTNQQGFNGSIDEVLVMNDSLSGSQIARLYQDGLEGRHMSTLVHNETSVGDVWSVAVTPNDQQNASDGATVLSNNVMIQADPNTHPSIAQVILNSTDGSGESLNTSSGQEALTVVIINSTDADGDSVQNITDWRRNGVSLALVNMPFETNVTVSTAGAVRDYSQLGANGTLGNGLGTAMPVWNSSAKVGGGYTFDGVDDYINVSGGNVSGDFTISTWIRTTSDANLKFIAGNREPNGDETGWEMYLAAAAGGGVANFQAISQSGGVIFRSGTSNVRNGAWHHIVVVRNGSAMFLYVNGTAEYGATGQGNGSVTSNSTTLLGRTPSLNDLAARRFFGTMDEFLVLNRSLSQQQVRQLYLDQNSGKHLETILPFEILKGENWSVAVTPNDNENASDGSTVISNTVTISNNAPSLTQAVLNSTDGSGSSANTSSPSENLTIIAVTASDAEGESIQNVTDWRVNGSSIALLNMPFESNISTAGGIVRDYSTSNITGLPGGGLTNGTPSWNSSGIVGGAYTFDGRDDYIDVTSGLSTLEGRTRGSIEFWFKSNDTTSAYVPIFGLSDKDTIADFAAIYIGDATGSFANESILFTNRRGVTDRLVFAVTNGHAFYKDMNWHHFVIVTGNGDNAIYVDGVRATNVSFAAGSSSTNELTDIDNADTVRIGSILTGTGNYAPETLDEFRFYNRTLTSQQVAQLYADGNAGLHQTTLVSQEVGLGDVWSVAVTPNDLQPSTDGSTVISNSVTIADDNTHPSIAQVILNSSDGSGYLGSNASTSENLTVFVINASDADGDSVQNITDWRVNGTSIAFLNMPFETNSSSIATGAIRDYSTFTNNGTLGGGSASDAPVWAEGGQAGGAYDFDGTSDFITIPHASNQNVGTTFSMEAWIKREGACTGNCIIVMKQNAASGGVGELRYALVVLSGGTLVFSFNTGSWADVVSSTTTISNDVWYHVVGTYDGANARLYVNGTLNNTAAKTGAVLSSTGGTIEIGRETAAATELFNGKIAEVSIYNRTLSAEQVALHFAAGDAQRLNVSAQETIVGDIWSVAVTPNDNQNASDGTTVLSNNVTILVDNNHPIIAQVILNSTDGSGYSSNISSDTENLTVIIINATDADNDSIQNITDWRVNGSSRLLWNLPFETNTSSTVTGAIKDYSQSRNGTLGEGVSANAPVWNAAGKVGGAYSFDGVNDYVDFGDVNDIERTDRVSFDFWINPNATDRFIMAKQDNFAIANGWYVYLTSNGSIYFALINDQSGNRLDTFSMQNSSLNQWTHVAITYDGSSLVSGVKMYFNGSNVSVGGSTSLSGSTVNAESLRIGCREGCSFAWFSGLIDEIRLWNRTLSSQQVTQSYIDGNASRHLQTIVSQELYASDIWSVAVTPNDQQSASDGTTVLSNEVVIQETPNTHPSIAQVILNSTDGSGYTGNNATTSENLTVFIINATDADNDAVQNITDWRVNGSSVALLSFPFETNSSNISAGAIRDYSSFGYNATLGAGTASAAPAWNASGQVGGAYTFDGSDDFIRVSSPPTFGGVVSVSAWIRSSAFVNGDGFGYGVSPDALSNYGWLVHPDAAGTVRFIINNGSANAQAVSTSLLANNQWQHIAGTYDGSRVRFFVNGTQEGVVNMSGDIQDGLFFIEIGKDVRYAAGRFLAGSLDEVMIFNRSLSQSQVAQLYQDGLARLHVASFVHNETSIGDVWSVAATPNDRRSASDGTTVLSNNVTILADDNNHPSIAQVILNNSNGAGHNLNISNVSSNLTVFIINASDADNDSIQNITDWRVNGTSVAVLNMPFETNVSLVSAGAVRDYSTLVNNATLGAGSSSVAPVWTSAGQAGGAYTFDGSDDFILIPDNDSLDGFSSMSIMFWARPTVSTVAEMIVKHNLSFEDIQWELFQSNQNIAGRIVGTDVTCTSTGNLFTTGSWHQVGLTWSGSLITLYIDGVSNTQCARAVSMSNSPGNVSIGRYQRPTPSNYPFSGSIDEILVFNRSLSSAQVLSLYDDGVRARHMSSLVPAELSVGNNWSVAVTPNDQRNASDGTTVLSNNVTILADDNNHPTIAQVILNSSDGSGYMANTSSTLENLTVFVIDASDADGDSVQNITDWRVNSASIAVLNLPFETNLSTNAVDAIRDYSTFGNNGTLGNGTASAVPVWNSSGKVGGAYTFDGANDYIDCGVSGLPSSVPVTLEAWARFNQNQGASEYDYMIQASGFDGNDLFAMAREAATNNVYYVENGVVRTGPVLGTGSWHHVVMVFRASAPFVRLYLNGTNQTITQPVGGALTPAGAMCSLGAFNTNTHLLNGSLDEVKIYNYELPADQVYQNYFDGNRSKHVETVVSAELTNGENWTVAVTPNDQRNASDGTTVLSNSVAIQNTGPSIAQVILNSTDGSGSVGGNASSNESLAVFVINATDGDNESVQNITDFRINGTSIARLNMPFETNVSSLVSGAVRDYSQSELNGTLGGGVGANAPVWNSSGKAGGAYTFVSNDYIDMGDVTAFDGLSALSWGAWVYPRSYGPGTDGGSIASIISKGIYGGGGTNTFFMFLQGDGAGGHTFSCGVDNGTLASGGGNALNLSLNQWNFVACTVSSGNPVQWYVNGTLVSVGATFSGSLLNVGTSLRIGGSGNVLEDGWNGSIDEVFVMPRALSQGQLAQMYQDGFAGLHVQNINASETTTGDVWSVAVTPNDNAPNTDGTTVLSNNVTILAEDNNHPSIAQVILNSTDGSGYLGNNATTSENLTVFIINATDADNDSIQNITDWRLNGTSIAVLNLPFETNVSVNTTILTDYSSFGTNATLGHGVVGSVPTWNSSGIVGGAYTFANDTIVINDTVDVLLGSSYSVELWFRTRTTSGTQVMFAYENTIDPDPILWQVNTAGTAMQFAVRDDSGVAALSSKLSSVVADTWHHVVGVRNGGTLTIYVDGVNGTPASAVFGAITPNALRIGAVRDQFVEHAFFNGSIDEVRVYNRSLSGSQVAQLYQDGLAGLHMTTLVHNETSVGDIWSVAVTPNDQRNASDGATVLSNNVTILADDVNQTDAATVKIDSPDPLNLTATTLLNYSITFNLTNGSASNVTFNESYPANVSFVNATPSPSLGNFSWDAGNLTAPYVYNISVLVNVSPYFANGTLLNNTVNVSFNNGTGSFIMQNATAQTTIINEQQCPQNITQSTTLIANISCPAAAVNILSAGVTLDCAGHVITWNAAGASNTFGIRAFVDNVTIQNCILQDGNASGANGIGIGVSGSAFVVTNNTISTNGTSGNIGVEVVGSHGTILNNMIRTQGTLGTNLGISFNGGSNNTVVNNSISTNGTATDNSGIRFFTLATANNISQNVISTRGTANDNWGITLAGGSVVRDNVVELNSISTSGGGRNFGIFLASAPMINNTIRANTVTTSGTGDFNDGVRLAEGQDAINNTITLNTVVANGSGQANRGIGLYVTGSQVIEGNNLSDNTVSTDGIGLSAAIIFNGGTSSRNVVSENTLTTAGSSGANYGIVFDTSPSRGNSFIGNSIQTGGAGLFNVGLNMHGADGDQIINNSISAGGTSDNYAIRVFSDATTHISNTRIEGNTMVANGTTGGSNFGVFLYHSTAALMENNTIVDNTITTDGAAGNNHAIFLRGLSGSTMVNNLAQNNIIRTYASAAVDGFSTGVFFHSFQGAPIAVYNNTISENDIRTQGAPFSWGASFDNMSNSVIELNNITTAGTTQNMGVRVDFGGDNNTVRNNRVLASGTGSNNFGITVTRSNNTLVENNRVTASGITSHGLRAANGANNTRFINNTVTTEGSLSYGIFVGRPTSGLGGNTRGVENVSFTNTTLVNVSEWVSAIELNESAFANTTFETSNGSILVPNFSLNGTVNITHVLLNMSLNNSFLNSSNLSFLNTSAQITLNGLAFGDPRPLVDFNDDGVFADCDPPQCVEVSFAGGIYVFNVSSFTSYAAQENLTFTINVSVDKFDSPDPVARGSQLSYQIQINSTGNASAINVTLVETYPPNVSFVSSQPTPSSGNNTFVIGNLSPSSSFLINITVNVSSAIPNGTTLNNSIQVIFTNSSGVNSTVNDSELTTVLGAPVVVSIKSDTPDPVVKGSVLNYTILVNNTGDDTAFNITLSEVYPVGVSLVSAQPTPIGNSTFTIGTLTPGASFLVNISVTVGSNVANGTILNNSVNLSFRNASGGQAAASDSELTTVLGFPIVAVTKTDSPDPVNNGSTLGYTITITNSGDDTAFNVTAIDGFDANVTFNGSAPVPTSGNNTFNVGNLSPGASTTINITVNVSASAAGVLNNTVNVSSVNMLGVASLAAAFQETTVTVVAPAPAPAGGSGSGGGGGAAFTRNTPITRNETAVTPQPVTFPFAQFPTTQRPSSEVLQVSSPQVVESGESQVENNEQQTTNNEQPSVAGRAWFSDVKSKFKLPEFSLPEFTLPKFKVPSMNVPAWYQTVVVGVLGSFLFLLLLGVMSRSLAHQAERRVALRQGFMLKAQSSIAKTDHVFDLPKLPKFVLPKRKVQVSGAVRAKLPSLPPPPPSKQKFVSPAHAHIASINDELAELKKDLDKLKYRVHHKARNGKNV